MTTKYDQLLSLINAINPHSVPFSLGNISFSDPIPDATTVKNTKITVGSVNGGGYSGNITLFYDRLNFQLLDTTVWLFSDIQFTNDNVISLLNTDRNCIFLSSADIVTLNIPNMVTGDIAIMSLVAQQNSVNWVGNTNLSLFMGFPAIENRLYDLVNTIFPVAGYLT